MIFPLIHKYFTFQSMEIRGAHFEKNFCLACLLSFDEQPGWAELVLRLGMSNLEKKYMFGILMKNCTKYVSLSQIRDVVGIPSKYAVFTTFLPKMRETKFPKLPHCEILRVRKNK